jgi:tetratricopeptide (TPR) repeat protein
MHARADARHAPDGLKASLAFPLRKDILVPLAGLAAFALVPKLLAGALVVEWLPAFRVYGPVLGSPVVVIALVLELLLAIIGMKIAVEALVDSAHRRDGGVGAGGSVATDDQALRQIGLLLASAFFTYLAALLGGTGAAWLVLVLAAALLPAVIARLALDGSLLAALDPRSVARLAVQLGPAYAGVVVVIGGLGLAAFVVGEALRWALPALLAAVPARLAGLYALVAAYHAIGRMLHAHRRALGLEQEVAPAIVRPRGASHEEDQVVAEAERLAAADRHAEAAEALRALMRRRGASEPVHAFYRTLLFALGDHEGLAAHARQHAANLVALGDEKHALALVADAIRLDPAFALEDPDVITPLVAHAAAAGHGAIAVRLAEDFGKRFPRSPDIVRNGLVAARLMKERLGRDADARALLQALDRAHPDDPLAGEVRAALYAPPT